MLDEYRIEPLSVGQYLDGVKSEDIQIVVQRLGHMIIQDV